MYLVIKYQVRTSVLFRCFFFPQQYVVLSSTSINKRRLDRTKGLLSRINYRNRGKLVDHTKSYHGTS